jgi:hypothetical protein
MATALTIDLCNWEAGLLLPPLQFLVRGHQHLKDLVPVLIYVPIQHETYLS